MPANMVFVDNTTLIPADWLNNVNTFVNAGTGAGSVLSVIFTNANGFTGTIANPTTNPAMTLGTGLTGILKGQGGSLVVATAGTDYLVAPTGTALLRANNGGALAAAVPGADYLPGTGSLLTGLLKTTTVTGALSIAVNSDLPAMSATVGGAVPTPPNNVSYFLRGDGVWGIPAGGGGGGGGSVSNVTGNNANGFIVNVANGTTVPQITVSVNGAFAGILKASGGSMSQAVAGSDYSAGTSALATGILKSTTTTGALSIAVAGDFPVLNQNTSGTAGGLSATLAVASGGTGVTTATGTGANVQATSPALVTPTADGFAVGYKIVPQVSQSAAYTTVLGDSGKHIYHPSADTTARAWVIDSNANVPYPIGTELTFINDNAAGVITLTVAGTDTMRLAGTGTTGARTIAANGIAVALKLTATSWIINGTGVT